MRKTIAQFLTVTFVFLISFTSPAFADDVIDGETGPGSIYRLVHPANWNGSLVLYAHGFASIEDPVALPAEGELLIALLAPLGYGVAYSSFSENGWAVKDGAQRTQQLVELFESNFGTPSKVYIGGASMGGLIAIKLVEEHPKEFVGALALCAVAGGARAQFDYGAHTRALFDVFYPGVLPGDAGNVPTDIDTINSIALPAAAAMIANPAGALAIASMDQTPVPFSTPDELLESIVTALVGHAGSFSEFEPELKGKPYFENQEEVYSGALDPALLDVINATVGRFEAAPKALNYLDKYYQPTGDLQMPMLMLSDSRDPVVPGFNQAAYSNLVTDAGNADLLVQRTVDRYGHCVFTPEETTAALFDLIAWVEYGIKPAP